MAHLNQSLILDRSAGRRFLAKARESIARSKRTFGIVDRPKRAGRGVGDLPSDGRISGEAGEVASAADRLY